MAGRKYIKKINKKKEKEKRKRKWKIKKNPAVSSVYCLNKESIQRREFWHFSPRFLSLDWLPIHSYELHMWCCFLMSLHKILWWEGGGGERKALAIQQMSEVIMLYYITNGYLHSLIQQTLAFAVYQNICSFTACNQQQWDIWLVGTFFPCIVH